MIKLLSLLGAVSAVMLALPAGAQSRSASGCLQACRIVSLPFPLEAPPPVGCNLFERGELLQNAPVVAAGDGAPSGSVACSFPVTLAPGTYSFAASAIAADGSESARSEPLEFALDDGGVITLRPISGNVHRIFQTVKELF